MEVNRPSTPYPLDTVLMEFEPDDSQERRKAAEILLSLRECPSCRSQDTYISHGLRTCNGCEDMICTHCRYGARYFCAYLLQAPSTPVSRQCSTEKWEMAEDYLRSHPEETETIADQVPNRHVYIVRRTAKNEFVREHKTLAEK